MSEGKRISDLQQLESIPKSTSYIAEAGDGSGTKRILHEVLLAALIEGIKLGSLKELNTESKDSMVAALNEVLKKATTAFEGTDGIKAGTAGMVPTPEPEDEGKVLGAGGKWVDIASASAGGKVLKSIEELEANTEEGYLVDALPIKEMNNDLTELKGKTYTGILTANSTSLTINIEDFNDNSLVDVYTDKWGVYPKTVELKSGSPNTCVMTWNAQTSAINVTIIIRRGDD